MTSSNFWVNSGLLTFGLTASQLQGHLTPFEFILRASQLTSDLDSITAAVSVQAFWPSV
jgi:hypothetical protein